MFNGNDIHFKIKITLIKMKYFFQFMYVIIKK